MLPEPQRNFDQSCVVGTHLVEADEVRHDAIHQADEVAALVVARTELAAPQIGEQRIVVVGLALGAQLGFGTRRLFLGLGRDGLGFVERTLGFLPGWRGLHLGFGVGPDRFDGSRAPASTAAAAALRCVSAPATSFSRPSRRSAVAAMRRR